MKHAYVTVLAGGDGYLPGVEVLGRSLVESGSTVPKVVLVTPDVSSTARANLRAQGWELRDIEPIPNPTPKTDFLFPRFAEVFAKLRAWELTDLDRAVLLDADTLVLQNVDDLFTRPGLDGPDAFAAAPDFFMPDRFNSGVMVLTPSRDTFGRMMAALRASPSYDGGDQGFLNTFYEGWYAMPAANRLPVGYNLANFIYQFMRGHPSVREKLEREAKILHYMVQKPWQARYTLTGASEAWWSTYFHAHTDEARKWKERVHAIEDRAFDAIAAWVTG
jgi:glycogenin glucosyltransferase